MKTNRLSRPLATAAILLGVVGVSFWAAAGARLGWTQTSVVALQRDAITGIDYPVRHAAFLPGIEVPLLALAVASALGLAAWASSRRPRTTPVRS